MVDSAVAADRTHPARMGLIVLGLAAGFAAIPWLTRGLGASAASNEEAPDFTATVVANAPDPAELALTLSKLRGHPVLLDFWATWCGPCQAQSPIVNGVAQRFRDRGLVVVGVNTSDAEGLAARFAAKKGLTFPMVYDEGNAIANKYRVENLPTLVAISKEGKVVAIRHGVTGDSDLERLIRPLL
jgi:thiol-disulfide isomerase/thioredoxin